MGTVHTFMAGGRNDTRYAARPALTTVVIAHLATTTEG
jgi:hypothetical protein